MLEEGSAKKKRAETGSLGSGGGSEEGLGEELPQMGEGQREGNISFRLFRTNLNCIVEKASAS